MFRFYLASAFLAFGLYGMAQYKGWSVMASEAQEFSRKRADDSTSSWGRGSSGGGSSGGSGHK
ncbi:hypothetical protein BWI17_02365 [Betaproteobacteria bacterium GR16-43]|nr:hypothetical protein BWI17_02365 [Betaproteobacteria bacterium GR16-43]